MERTSELLESKLPTLYRVTEVAAHLRLSRGATYRLMREGLLPFVKIGHARRIRLDDLQQLIDGHTVTVNRN